MVMTMPQDIGETPERDRAIADRNILFGLWAADRLDLKGQARETYAMSVHLADLEAPGLDDVIAKVKGDFEAAGIEAGEAMLRGQLHDLQERALMARLG